MNGAEAAAAAADNGDVSFVQCGGHARHDDDAAIEVFPAADNGEEGGVNAPPEAEHEQEQEQQVETMCHCGSGVCVCNSNCQCV